MCLTIEQRTSSQAFFQYSTIFCLTLFLLPLFFSSYLSTLEKDASLLTSSPLPLINTVSSSLLQKWQARINLEDIQGSTSTFQEFIHISPHAKAWSEHEICLIADTLRLRGNIAAFAPIYKQLQLACISQEKQRAFLERYSWAILKTASNSFHPKIRFEAIVGAAMSGDSRAVEFICNGLCDDNKTLRQFALEIASYFPDTMIQNQLALLASQADKDERLIALQLLIDQEWPHVTLLLQKMKQAHIWTIEEKAQLILYSLFASEHIQSTTSFSHAIFSSLVYSSKIEEQLAALHYAERFLCPHINDILVETILSHTDHQTLILKSFELLGRYPQHTSTKNKTYLQEYAIRLIQTCPRPLVQARAAWYLIISNSSLEIATIAKNWLIDSIVKTNSEEKQKFAVAHLRALGPYGVDMALSLLSKYGIIAKEEMKPQLTYTLSIEDQLTLATYLLEQRQSLPLASHSVLTAIDASSSLYLAEDRSLGDLFSYFCMNCAPQDPYFPQMKASQHVYIRLKLYLLLIQIQSNQPTHEEIVRLLQKNDVVGIEHTALCLLYGELKLPLQDVQNILDSTSVEKRLQFAINIATLSRTQEALQIIQKICDSTLLSKEERNTLLACLSLFPIDMTEHMILPYLFDSSFQLQTRASGAYLSSLFQ